VAQGPDVIGAVENASDPTASGLDWTDPETWSHPTDTSNQPLRTGGGPDATAPVGGQAVVKVRWNTNKNDEKED